MLEEGKDYKILSQSGRSITIEALDEEGCLPYINAKVQQPSAVPSTAAVTTSGVAAVPPATKRETEAQAQMRTEKQTEKKHCQGKPAGIAFGCAGCLCFGCGCPCTLAKKAAPIRE